MSGAIRRAAHGAAERWRELSATGKALVSAGAGSICLVGVLMCVILFDMVGAPLLLAMRLRGAEGLDQTEVIARVGAPAHAWEKERFSCLNNFAPCPRYSGVGTVWFYSAFVWGYYIAFDTTGRVVSKVRVVT